MKVKASLIIHVILFILVRLGECYNILVLFGHPGKSHYEVFKPLFQELNNRGHNITIISHINTEGDIKNGHHVLLSDRATTNFIDVRQFPGGRWPKYYAAYLIKLFADLTCKPGLQRKELQRFLKADNHFDVILVEFFNSNCFYGIINKYKAPFIGMSSNAMMAWHPQWVGAPDNPSYISTIYMAYPSPMTFLERVENTLVHLGHQLIYEIFIKPPGIELSKKYVGYEPVDPYNASLLLVNTHHSLHGVRPLPPAMVEVGGIHVANRKPKILPKEIEKWTNESSAGLIYFSFGSVLNAHTFPEEKLKVIIKKISKMPQRILWKWDNETMMDKPDNIMLIKWAPQFDILCHPNTKLFISHGGLLGITEAVHCGVPVLVMPQFGDQPLNAKVLEKNGAGVILVHSEATQETFSNALEKALSLETRKKAQYLSERFKDRLVSPLDTAVFWVEHIAKHKGGGHMRSAAIDMPFYQYLLLDVVAFLAFVIFLLVFIIYKSSKLILRMCFSSKQKIKKS